MVFQHTSYGHIPSNISSTVSSSVFYIGNAVSKCGVCVSFQVPHQDFKFRASISSPVSSSIFNITNAVSKCGVCVSFQVPHPSTNYHHIVPKMSSCVSSSACDIRTPVQNVSCVSVFNIRTKISSSASAFQVPFQVPFLIL